MAVSKKCHLARAGFYLKALPALLVTSLVSPYLTSFSYNHATSSAKVKGASYCHDESKLEGQLEMGPERDGQFEFRHPTIGSPDPMLLSS